MSCTMNPRMAVTKDKQETANPRYGLLSAATVVEAMEPHAHNGIEYVVTCDSGLGLYPTGPGQCEAGEPPNNPTKTATPGRWISRADPFAIYGAEPCVLGNQDETEARNQLRRRILRGERHLVEMAVDSGYAGASPYLRHEDTALAADDPLPLRDALGVLEQKLAEVGRSGIIHAPRWAAHHLDRHITRDGPRLRTTLGTSVVLGSGYSGKPPENLDDDGRLWLYATPQVTVRRSEILEPANWSEGAFNPRTTSGFLRAERVYVIDWPCHTWAIPVDMERAYTPQPPTTPAPGLTLSHQGNTTPLQVEAHASNWGNGPVDLDWGDGSEIQTVEDGDTATHTHTEAGTYTVTATSQANPDASTTRRVRVIDPLSAPSNVQIDAPSPVEATATWEFDAGDGPEPTGFDIRWRPEGGYWSQRTQLGAQARSWDLPEAEPDTTYEVGVRARTRQETSPETTGTGTTPGYPDPDLSVDPSSGPAPLQVEATVDNHGNGPVGLDWGEGDPVEVADGGTATHTYAGAGSYTVTATSQLWEEASGTASVTVTEPEDPSLTVDPTEGEAPLQVEVSVDNPGNGPVDLAWGDDSDPTEVADGGTATHTYEEAGDYTVTATSQANEEAQGTATVTVTAPAPEDPSLTVDPSSGPAPLEVTATVDNHGNGPANVTFGDDSDPAEVADGGTATHTYDSPGDYTVTATSQATPDSQGTATVTVDPID